MKHLTKFLTIALIGLFSLQSNAQTFGVKGGLNLSNVLSKDDEATYSDDFKMNPGFHIGATVDFPLNDFLSVEPGLLFTTKGMKIKEESSGFEYTSKANVYYLDIPVTLRATHELSDGFRIFGAVGPYVGYGLSGKMKTTVEYQGEKETGEEDLNLGNDENDDDLKRLDMGLTLGGGVEISSILLGISYDLGLSNNSPYQDYGTTLKNRQLKVSIGYRFGG